MSSQPRAPRVSGKAAQLAQALRAQPEGLDEVTRARMERSLVQAWRTRAAANVPLPVRTKPERAQAAHGGRPRWQRGRCV